MRFRKLKHLPVVALAAVGLALAGCGGGGGDTPTAAAPTPQEMCEADGGTYADGMCTTAAQAEAAMIAGAIEAAKTAAEREELPI